MMIGSLLATLVGLLVAVVETVASIVETGCCTLAGRSAPVAPAEDAACPRAVVSW